MNLIFNFTIMVLGMIGGQVAKGARRFGIPGLAVIFTLLKSFKEDKSIKNKYKYLAFLLFIPILIMGYGIDSKLMKWFKKEWIVRAAYGFILSLPFGIFLAITKGSFITYIICVASLVGAYSIRAGRLGHIGKFDFLIEDMIRYFVLGRLILIVS